MSDRDRLAATLQWLCEIPSPTGEESSLCEAVATRLAALSLAAPARRHGDSLVVPVTAPAAGPRIALAGHLDVVRTEHDGPVRIEGDRLYGPGASDMKSGLALMIDLVEQDLAACAGVGLTLVFYAREEGPYLDNELGVVFEHEPDLSSLDLAVCLEPSDNRLSLGACGSLHAAVRFEGTTAHSARPWQGRNAIHQAGDLLVELAAREPQTVTIDGLDFATTTSVTLAQGGRGRNVVPDEFVLNVNHRFAPNRSVAEAQRDLEMLVGSRAQITWADLSPAAPPHGRHPLVEALRGAGVTAIEPKQAWTDVARFAQHGVAAVNFGPGVNAQAHQRNEWTSLTQLEQGRTILLAWLQAASTS